MAPQTLTIVKAEPLDDEPTALSIVKVEPLEPVAPVPARGFTDPASVRVTSPTPSAPSAIRPVASNASAPAEPPAATLVDRVKDLGISTLKGAIGVPEAAVGVLDIPSGGRVGQFLERVVQFKPQEAKAILNTFYSEQQQRANRSVEEADGAIDTAIAALSNPSTIVQSVVESAPLMLGGGAIGRGLTTLGLRGVTAGAIGEGAVSAGAAAEQTRAGSKDGRLTAKQATLATASGAATGALGLFGGRLARTLGIADVDTLLAGGVKNATARSGLTKAVVFGAVQEGFLEELPQSVQEQVLGNIAAGKPWDQGVDQAAVLGALAGAVMGGGAQVGEAAIARRPAARAPSAQAPAAPPPQAVAAPPSPSAAGAPAATPVETAGEPSPPLTVVKSEPLVDEAGRELGGYAGPERRAVDQGPPAGIVDRRAPAPGGDVVTRVQDKLAAGEQLGTPEARAAFEERQRVEAARPAEPPRQEPVVDVTPEGERETHTFSSTQVNLPAETAGAIRQMALAIPDEDLAPDGRAGDSEATAPHVTVKYGLHTNDVEKVRAVLEQEPPITLALGKTSYFPNGESGSGDVLKVDVDSADLHRLNAKIAEALEVTDTHPDYKPHATIAYLKPGKGKDYEGDESLVNQTVTIDRVTFSTKDGKIFEIPLTGQQKAETGPARKPFTEHIAELRAEQVAWRDKIRTTFERDGIVKTRLKNGTEHIIHSSTQEPGKFQVTHFENGEPTGHMVADTLDEAAKLTRGDTLVEAGTVPATPPAALATVPRLALRVEGVKAVRAVADFEEAGRLVDEMRDQSGLGASEFPQTHVIDVNTGEVVARISYNGRIWDPKNEKVELVERIDRRGYGKPAPIDVTPTKPVPAVAAPTAIAGTSSAIAENPAAIAAPSDGETIPDNVLAILKKGFPNLPIERWQREGTTLIQTADPALGKEAIGLRIDVSADPPTVESIGPKRDRQVTNFVRQRFAAIVKKQPWVRSALSGIPPAGKRATLEGPADVRSTETAPAVRAPEDPGRPASGIVPRGDRRQRRAPDEGRVVEGRGARNREGGGGPLTQQPDLTDPTAPFVRLAPAVNAPRFTPHVVRALERIGAELEEFGYASRTWDWDVGPRKSGNAAGGEANIVAGHGGAPVYWDILEHAPLNRNPKTGEPAARVSGSRDVVIKAVQLAISSHDIHNNLAEGAVRVAEKRARGEWKGLRPPALPENWNEPADVGETIDRLASDDQQFTEVNEALQAAQDASEIVEPEDGDISFDPEELQAQAPAATDVLDTGELQPRLPEAGEVREQEIATPEFEAPFSLAAEADTTVREREASLFEVPAITEPPAREPSPEPEQPSPKQTPDRDALIEKIVAASREPLPEIVESKEHKGTDGKWYNALGMPWGVQATGELRSAGFVYRDQQGTTYGKRYATEAEAREAAEARREQHATEFREQLRGESDERLQSQASYWLKTGAQPGLAGHDAFIARLRKGDVNPYDLKNAFEQVLNDRAKLIAQLSGLKKDELLKRFGAMGAARWKSEKKAAIVEHAYRELLNDFVLSTSLTYNPMAKGGFEAAVRAQVENATEQTIADYAARVAEATEAHKKRVEGYIKAVKNPETLDEFDTFVRAHKDGEAALTPEQRTRYDELRAEAGREKRQAAQQQRATVEAAGQQVEASIIETKHTKHGYDLFVVQLAQRVEREDYNRLNLAAKKLGGWYSSYRGGGAVPGFQFKTRDAADAFHKLVTEGDTAAATEAAVERRATKRETKKNAAAERLADMADRLEADAQAKLSADRLVNTARRAAMAASAEAQARSSLAMARTLRNLADAIESGKATHLDGIRTKVQVETLERIAEAAKRDTLRAQYPEYRDYEQHEGRAVEAGDIDRAEYPEVTATKADLLSAARSLGELEGGKRIAARLTALAKRAEGETRIEVPKAIVVEAVGKEDELSSSRRMLPWHWASRLGDMRRLETAGIPDLPTLRAALREFIQYRGEKPEADRVKELERALAGNTGIGIDFFPTPQDLAQRVAAEANIQPGMRVLEPSAGKGNLADAVRAVEPSAEIDTIEVSSTLREILEAKGYPLVGTDFDAFGEDTIAELREDLGVSKELLDAYDPEASVEKVGRHWSYSVLGGATHQSLYDTRREAVDAATRHKELKQEQFDNMEAGAVVRKRLSLRGTYDRVVMNPPFSNGQDAAHVQRAYQLLKPGGRLVAITGEGIFFRQDAKAKAFRDWFESVGGTSEKLEGAFTDRREVKTTNVASRLLIIDKPAETVAAPSPSPADREPWQMTRAEFIAEVREGRDFKQLGVNPSPLATLRGANAWESLDRQAGDHHEARTTIAVAQGTPVSARVLKDYPALAKRDAATEREDWQLTREEYARRQLREIADVLDKNPEMIGYHRREKFREAAEWPDLLTRLSVDERQKYLAGHRESVAAALAEGKPVPPEVAAEYPDLKPAAGGGTEAFGFVEPFSAGAMMARRLWEAHRGRAQAERVPLAASSIPDVEARWDASRGIQPESIRQKAREALDALKKLSRHYPEIDPSRSPVEAVAMEILLEQERAPKWAQAVAHDRIADIVEGLVANEADLLARALALPDILKDIEAGLYDGRDLPFGYGNKADVQRDMDRVTAAVAEHPKVKAAVTKRSRFIGQLTQELVDADLLPASVLEDPRYYHRQVLAYMSAQEQARVGATKGREVRQRRRGFQKGRVGGSDFNTRYVEAEYEWVAQALTELKTKATLDELKALTDQTAALKAQAKRINRERLGEKLIAQYNRSGVRPGQDDADLFDVADARMLAEDALKPFNQQLAISIRGVLEALAQHDYELSDRFREAAEELADAYIDYKAEIADLDPDERPPFNADHPLWWPLLADLVKHPTGAGKWAGSIFKTIRAREDFIKETLGNDYIDRKNPEDLLTLAPEDHVTWQPKEGNQFFRAQSVDTGVLEKVLAGERTLSEDDKRSVMAMGAPRETWIIPDWLAQTLDHFGATPQAPGPLGTLDRLWTAALATWKQQMLMFPGRIVRYNLNNMSGDMDAALAYAPGVFTHLPASARFLYHALYGGAPEGSTRAQITRRMERLIELGVIDAGLTALEIPDVNKLEGFRKLAESDPQTFMAWLLSLGPKYYAQARKITQYRENLLRLAAYDYMLTRGGTKTYAASNAARVEALRAKANTRDGKERLAALLARDLIGDYQAVSSFTQFMRSRTLPFFSFQEVNFKRYVNLFRNASREGKTVGEQTWQAASAAGTTAARLGVKWGVRFALANAFMVSVVLWNKLFFPDEDDELRRRGRQQLHLILGRYADGAIRSVRIEGAFADFLEWAGLQNYIGDVEALVRKDMTIADKLVEVAQAAPNKVVQLWEPFTKLLFEQVTGRRTFPNAFRPTPIRDRWEHLTGIAALDQLYSRVTGKPVPPGNPVGRLLLYRTDPGEAAYYDVRTQVAKWLEANGKQRGGGDPTARSNALYYWKRAEQWGDQAAADRWLRRYRELGGTSKGLRQSVTMSAPLGALNRKDRLAFRKQLRPDDRKILEMAEAWYRQVYGNPRRLRVAVGR